MSIVSCALKGVWYYRRINVVVAAAIAIATTVIGGSLIVGDSVRYSLRQMTQQRLGHITDVLAAPLFFRQALVDELAEEISVDVPGAVFAPVMMVTAGAEASATPDELRRVGSVSVVGIEDTGWQLLETGGISVPSGRDVVLGYRTAQGLSVQAGDTVSLWVEVPASIPRDSLLGEREDVNVEVVLTVRDVVPETVGASRFDLNPGQQLPYNAFVSLQTLQERLGLEEVEASRRNPVAQPGRINTIFVGTDSGAPDGSTPEMNARLNDQVGSLLTVEDLGIRVRQIPERNFLSVETDRMILSEELSLATQRAARERHLSAAPAVVYLSNEIFATDRQTSDERYSMYSILAGLNFDNSEPLGSFRLKSGEVPRPPDPDEIVLSAWLAQDLEVSVGDQVTTLWHEVGSHGELPEVETTFTVAGILAENDPVSVDRNLTPHVQGVTDVESFDEVDQPFEMDMDRLTSRDDDYWDSHRATPKAFVSLATGERFWESRFGTHTSIRVAAAPGDTSSLDDIAGLLADSIPRYTDPAGLGIHFRPVLADGLRAAVGANDFTQLFIGFGFFLILSAFILVSLMFRLGTQQRIRQLGLLNTVGWQAGRIRWLFLSEGLLVGLFGAAAGTAGAVIFGRFMIHALTTWWIGAVGTRFLMLDVQPMRLVIAFMVALVLAGIVIWHALRSFTAVGVRAQLAGDTSSPEERALGPANGKTGTSWKDTFGLAAIAIAVSAPLFVTAGVVPRGEAFGGLTWPMVCFFVAGLASLMAGLYLLNRLLTRRGTRRSDSLGSLLQLALTNTARNPQRTKLTTALIALATFVIVAVGAGRRNPLTEVPDRASGNGGFSIVAESAQPILFDLNTPDGRARAGIADWEAGSTPMIYPFSMRPGSDASCVNLYQTRIPTVLGASERFIQRGGFRFADTAGDNPWENLVEDPLPDVDGLPVIPVIGDANTLMYSLKKDIGSRIAVPDINAPQYLMEIVGKLDGSVFQGVLITTDEHLKSVEQDTSGARYFLIETPLSTSVNTARVLEAQLRSFGFDTEPVNDRIDGYLAVQNTYLSTFQMLGGLGLFVGTFGLAAVMLRNVIEREGEFALMTAVGYRRATIRRLIVTENCMLLLWGIGVGSLSALLAMSPHLISAGGSLPVASLLATLVLVTLTGIAASWFAIRRAGSVPLRDGLSRQ